MREVARNTKIEMLRYFNFLGAKTNSLLIELERFCYQQHIYLLIALLVSVSDLHLNL